MYNYNKIMCLFDYKSVYFFEKRIETAFRESIYKQLGVKF
jgi:hypothetical protein